jgi:hypothetical protein
MEIIYTGQLTLSGSGNSLSPGMYPVSGGERETMSPDRVPAAQRPVQELLLQGNRRKLSDHGLFGSTPIVMPKERVACFSGIPQFT